MMIQLIKKLEICPAYGINDTFFIDACLGFPAHPMKGICVPCIENQDEREDKASLRIALGFMTAEAFSSFGR